MLDRYLWGQANRISPESPVPIVRVQTETEALGGAGNVAANICGLGLSAIPIGIAGDDLAGEKIKHKRGGSPFCARACKRIYFAKKRQNSSGL